MVCKYCSNDYHETYFDVANIVNGKVYRRRKCRRCKQDRANARRHEQSEWLEGIKKNLACIDCGVKDHRIIDFHHISQTNKTFAVSDTNRRGMSKERILEEISKCVPICANCHRIRHYDGRL